jgi:DNA polymerase-1
VNEKSPLAQRHIPVNLNPQKTVLLIDGSSFLYRAYYGLRPLHTSKGIPVQAVYSFCRMIKKLVEKFQTQHIALVWDSKGTTVRHEMYQAYKATRQAAPSDLFDQKELIVKFADLINLKQVAQQGVEADDLMYSLAHDVTKQGYTAVFVTSDKDMRQALSDTIIIFDPFKEQFIGLDDFQTKMGFGVEKFPFYFALLGDSSDNIPGVKGIGEKGATELVQQFDSLDDMYKNLNTVTKERTRTLLQEQKDNAYLSEKLFKLHYYPINITINDLQFSMQNWAHAQPLFQELEFKSLLKEVAESPQAIAQPAPSPTQEEPVELAKKYSFKTITTEQDLQKLCAEIITKKACAIDTETTGLRALQDECVGISVCTQKGTAYYIPFGHHTIEAQLPREVVIAALKPIFEDASIKKYLYHANFDRLVLHHAGINLQGVAFDGILAANLVLKDWQKLSLKDVSMYLFNEKMITYDEVVKEKKLKDFSFVTLVPATEYAAADAHQTFKLTPVFEQQLTTEKLSHLLFDVELPLSEILYKMELAGIYCDATVLTTLDKRVTHDLQTIINDIVSLVGEAYRTINLNSTQQVGKLLFEHLKLPPKKKSAKGTTYSTDSEVLDALSELHPVPALILKYRELAKLKNTYIDALPTYINPTTGKIHTTFSQTTAATGRLASHDPNLQNIPTDSTGYGIEIRAAFKPQQGHVFLSADYSQIELRVLAHLSQDATLLRAFSTNTDIHKETAALLFQVPLDQVTNEQRQLGKRINFSILYGLTPFGLSKDLKIPLKDAKTYIDRYFEKYPQVSTWMERTVEDTKKNGYVTTWLGRRRYVPGIYEKNRSLYELARRIAINTVAQGTAAEIMKVGMINLQKAFDENKCGAHMVLQIHDELLISVPESEQAKTETIVKKTLVSVVQWSVPLEVTTRFGGNWKEVSK